jgi:phosphoribosyl 1,2-cyclic phosphate phosphodiesterase
MEIIVLGSGGFQTIPRPCCQCKVCSEARTKGIPYSRRGPSIFVKDINALFDTPKDIIESTNRENIKKIENIFYTHWHPDHTEGMRIVEEVTAEWSKDLPYILKNHKKPIKLFAPKEVLSEIKRIRSPVGSYLDYFEKQDFIKTHLLTFEEGKEFDGITIIPIKLNSNKELTSSSYLFQEQGKNVVYMPCDLKPALTYDFLQGVDLWMVGSPFMESELGLRRISENHPLRKELFSMSEIINLIKKYDIKKTVITHIEEMWRLSYDDYRRLEEKYKRYNIVFSYDGLRIKI